MFLFVDLDDANKRLAVNLRIVVENLVNTLVNQTDTSGHQSLHLRIFGLLKFDVLSC